MKFDKKRPLPYRLLKEFSAPFLVVLITLLLSACGAKVKASPDFLPGKVHTLALLPAEYNSKVQREKVDALFEALESELRNYGFVVLADRLVREICSGPQCPERSTLAKEYLVDGFVSLEVDSVSRANFLAGYYNAIRGSLKITDANNKELLSVANTESEKGGLVFNSGQVIQGLISQVENTEEKSFARLAGKFSETIVSKIPRPETGEVNRDAIAVSIGSVEAKRIHPAFIELCAAITPHSLASLVVNRQRSTLRETKIGRYCGAFFLDEETLANGSLQIEARSPYGDAVRKEVPKTVSAGAICDLTGNVKLLKVNGKDKIDVACSIKPSDGGKLLVFRSDKSIGPFQKVGDVKSSTWLSPKSSASSNYRYEVVAVAPSGNWSPPESAKPVKGNDS